MVNKNPAKAEVLTDEIILKYFNLYAIFYIF